MYTNTASNYNQTTFDANLNFEKETQNKPQTKRQSSQIQYLEREQEDSKTRVIKKKKEKLPQASQVEKIDQDGFAIRACKAGDFGLLSDREEVEFDEQLAVQDPAIDSPRDEIVSDSSTRATYSRSMCKTRLATNTPGQ
jgi:hypothetical protein